MASAAQVAANRENAKRPRTLSDETKESLRTRALKHGLTSKRDVDTVLEGGVGTSLVIDPEGRLWRARNYEDFETTYRIEGNTCEIEPLRPIYSQMRQYVPK